MLRLLLLLTSQQGFSPLRTGNLGNFTILPPRISFQRLYFNDIGSQSASIRAAAGTAA